MKLSPTDRQEASIQRVLEEESHGALIAYATGFGKTLITSEIILRAGWRRVLIIGVRDTASQWDERMREQSDRLQSVRIINSSKAGQAAFDDFMAGRDGIFFSGLEYMRSKDWETHDKIDPVTGKPELEIDSKTGMPTGKTVRESKRTDVYGKMTRKFPLDAVVVDEIHKVANRKTNGIKTLRSIKTDWRIGLSATWFGNAFSGAWAPAKWVFPEHVDGSSVRWVRDFCATETLYAGGKEIEKVVGERIPGSFVATLPCYLREEPEPEPEALVMKVKLTPEQKAQYERLEKDKMAWLKSQHPEKGDDWEPLIVDLPIVERARLRTAALGEMSFDADGEIQFAADCVSNKLSALRFILDNKWAGMPVVVFCHSKRFAKVVHSRLVAAGYGAQLWTGDQTGREREEIKAKFIAKDASARYIVAVIDALREGVDGLQFASSRVIWLSRSDSAIYNEQALGRIWRRGMTSEYGEFQHIEIVSESTIDEKVRVTLSHTQAAARASMRTAA